MKLDEINMAKWVIVFIFFLVASFLIMLCECEPASGQAFPYRGDIDTTASWIDRTAWGAYIDNSIAGGIDVIVVNTHILPDADNGADLGTEGTQFDSLFVGNIVADTIIINTEILPDVNDGADLGTEGTQFDSLFVDDILVTGVLSSPAAAQFTGATRFGASGTEISNFAYGIASFTGTDTRDTVVISGLVSGATVIGSCNLPDDKISSNDAVISFWAGANDDTLFTERASSGTSGLQWSYLCIWFVGE